MNELEKQIMEIPCRNCKKTIKLKMYELLSRREAKCSYCGSMFKFQSTDVSHMKTAIRDLEKAQEKYGEKYGNLFENADFLIKGK